MWIRLQFLMRMVFGCNTFHDDVEINDKHCQVTMYLWHAYACPANLSDHCHILYTQVSVHLSHGFISPSMHVLMGWLRPNKQVSCEYITNINSRPLQFLYQVWYEATAHHFPALHYSGIHKPSDFKLVYLFWVQKCDKHQYRYISKPYKRYINCILS